MDKGPVLSKVLNLTTDESSPGYPSIRAENISEPSHYEVTLKSETDDDELSEAELALLNEIFSEHGKKSRWELVEFTHQLPEWINPQGSAIAINYRDILKAGGKSDLEIAAVESELAELAGADLLLASH